MKMKDKDISENAAGAEGSWDDDLAVHDTMESSCDEFGSGGIGHVDSAGRIGAALIGWLVAL